MKKLTPFWIAFLCLALAAAGCKKDDGGSTKAESPPSSSTGGSEPKTASAAPDPSSIPSSLKHQGFEYSGLDYAKQMEFELKRPIDPAPQAGTQVTKLVAVEGEAARYVTERTGMLAQLGSEEKEVRPDGVYNTRIGGQPAEPAQLELPADMSPGKTWTSKGTVKVATGDTLEQNMSFKIVGPEKVTIKAGTYDSIKITGQGEVKTAGKTLKLTMAAWYVKGLGSVLLTMKSQDGDMRMEATKIP